MDAGQTLGCDLIQRSGRDQIKIWLKCIELDVRDHVNFTSTVVGTGSGCENSAGARFEPHLILSFKLRDILKEKKPELIVNIDE